VEVLRKPLLDGRPLVLGSPPGEKKEVLLVSPEAERMGIRVGLPLREVIPLCRDAIVIQPDPVRTGTVVEEVVRGLQQVSPHIEADNDHLFLDLRGLKELYGDLATLEAAVRSVVPAPLLPRLGVGSGKFVSAVAAAVAPPLGSHVVPRKETSRFLAGIPVRYLPLGPEDQQRLDWLGLRTIGQLAKLPFSAVQAEFGTEGARSWKLAHGEDNEPLIPRRYMPSIQASVRFDDPIASVEALMTYLDQLLATAFSNPQLQGRSVRQLRLRALLSDSTSWERVFTVKEAISSRAAAKAAMKSKLELPNGMPPAPIDELLLELLGLGGEAAKQGSLFLARAKQLAQIAEAGRQLSARFGATPLYQPREVEPWSRIPERRWALVRYDG
jgi:DNA polymerase-4/protein ImuB